MGKRRTFDDIEADRQQLDFEQADLLRKAGWHHTSELGALWLWKKEIPGRGLLYVNKECAIHLVENAWLLEPTHTEKEKGGK